MLTRTAERPVIVDGRPKGAVFKLAGRWRWRRSDDRPGTDSYARGANLSDVRAHIKRVCLGAHVVIKSRKE